MPVLDCVVRAQCAREFIFQSKRNLSFNRSTVTLRERSSLLERKHDMPPTNRNRIEYQIPTRGLIGFRGAFMTMTSGTGIMTSIFSHYGNVMSQDMSSRTNGVLVSMASGKALAYAIWNLQSRGRMFILPNEEVYEGMVIGLHSRGNDLIVNPLKGKQLTNVRASGTDEAIILTGAIRHTLEQAIEFIEDDELVEVTPTSLRMRKKLLTENERKRAGREKVA